MNTIERSFVGTITENGEAYCYGVALHKHQLVYLDIAGSAETLKTIRTKLVSLGKLCYLNPPRGKTLYLHPGGSQTLEVHQKKIAYGLVHAMMVAKTMRDPLYHEKSWTYLIYLNEPQAQARLGQHIHALLPIPVRQAWYGYLWQVGRAENLITPCEQHGGIQVYAVDLDQTRWTTLLQTGLRDGILHLQP